MLNEEISLLNFYTKTKIFFESSILIRKWLIQCKKNHQTRKYPVGNRQLPKTFASQEKPRHQTDARKPSQPFTAAGQQLRTILPDIWHALDYTASIPVGRSTRDMGGVFTFYGRGPLVQPPIPGIWTHNQPPTSAAGMQSALPRPLHSSLQGEDGGEMRGHETSTVYSASSPEFSKIHHLT